jgi:hypothetical protein
VVSNLVDGKSIHGKFDSHVKRGYIDCIFIKILG